MEKEDINKKLTLRKNIDLQLFDKAEKADVTQLVE